MLVFNSFLFFVNKEAHSHSAVSHDWKDKHTEMSCILRAMLESNKFKCSSGEKGNILSVCEGIHKITEVL